MLDFRKSSINSALRKVLKRFHYPLEVMLTCVRWYVAYPLSLRHVEEMMRERGVFVDHATVHRWAIKMVPVLAAVFRRRKNPVGKSWRMDETYMKVAGQWKYLYRAVGRAGYMECPHYHCRHRDHAHDRQGADGLPRRQTHVCSAAVLQPRCLISSSATQLFSAKLHYCERTTISTDRIPSNSGPCWQS